MAPWLTLGGARGPLLCQRRDGLWLHVFPMWGKGYGSTASLRLGMAMAPRPLQKGDGLWLHCFPKVGDGQMRIGWDREGCAPRRMCFVAGCMERPTLCMFRRASPQKRVALRAFPGLVVTRLAAISVCWRVI